MAAFSSRRFAVSSFSPAFADESRHHLKLKKAARYPDADAVWADLERCRKRPARILALVLSLAFLVSVAFATVFGSGKDSGAAEDSGTLLTDPTAIDEIFRQATEMVISEDGQ